MIIDQENHTIHLRQSWLDTFFRCPEDARFAAVSEPTGTTDEAFIGTATHAGIEAVINGSSMQEAKDAIAAEYATNLEAQDLRFTKRESIDECIDLSLRCFDAWVRDILPVAPIGGAQAEVSFEAPLMQYRDWLVSIKGTADLVPATGNWVWDWKTAGSNYSQKDKQKWAVQPTVYSMAAVMGAFGRTDYTWPVEFVYGVMVKLKRECRGQIVRVQRNQQHVAWLEHRIRAAVDLYLDFGLDRSWPMIEEKNFLCSAKWCDSYDQCRGKFIAQETDLFGWDPQ
jgi:hypothetical protein